MQRINVLFLCTGNSCRSLMAEALLRDRAGDRFAVYSAGTDPRGVHPLTKRVLEEIGVDTSLLNSKSVTEYLGRLFARYVIIVCQQADAECPRIFPGMGTRLNWRFDDPAAATGSEEERLAVFRRVRDEIADAIDAFLASQP